MRLKRVLVACSLALLIGNVQAALNNRGAGLLYDDVTGLIWLQDANLSATETFGVSGIGIYTGVGDGRMTWDTAKSWITAMNNANYLGYNDWRLPTVRPANGVNNNYYWSPDGTTESGPNISANGTAYAGSTGSEMAYMYYQNLGLTAYISPSMAPQSDFGLYGNGTYGYYLQGDVGPVKNLKSWMYWYGLEGAGYIPPQGSAWGFDFSSGSQGPGFYKSNMMNVWAVRDGDVAAVPEPGAYAMLLAGLSLLGVVARRKSA